MATFQRTVKRHILKQQQQQKKPKPQSSATEVMTAGIIKDGDNKRKVMPLSPANEIQFDEMRV